MLRIMIQIHHPLPRFMLRVQDSPKSGATPTFPVSSLFVENMLSCLYKVKANQYQD